MNAVIGRVLTGVCGGLVMAGVNHWNSLQGWAYGGSIAAGFAVFFIAAVVFDRRTSKAPAAAPAPAPASTPVVVDQGIGSGNQATGKQDIDIAASSLAPVSGPIGSGNTAGGDQKIKIS